MSPVRTRRSPLSSSVIHHSLTNARAAVVWNGAMKQPILARRLWKVGMRKGGSRGTQLVQSASKFVLFTAFHTESSVSRPRWVRWDCDALLALSVWQSSVGDRGPARLMFCVCFRFATGLRGSLSSDDRKAHRVSCMRAYWTAC